MTPYIEWKEGFVSRWINSSQLALVPDTQEPARISDYRSRSRLANIDVVLLRIALTAAAQQFGIQPWMVKRPSKNLDVQKARAKAAWLLMSLRDNGVRTYTDEQVAIALDYYDLPHMIEEASQFDEAEF